MSLKKGRRSVSKYCILYFSGAQGTGCQQICQQKNPGSGHAGHRPAYSKRQPTEVHSTGKNQ